MAEPFCTILPTEPKYPKISFTFPPIAIAGVEPTTTFYYATQIAHTRDISQTLCFFANFPDGIIFSQIPASIIYTENAILVGCSTPIRNSTDEKLLVFLSWDGRSADNTSITQFTYESLFLNYKSISATSPSSS